MRIIEWSSDVCSSDLPSNSACFVVIMRIDHWKIGNSLADRHDQERQQSKPRPVTTIRVQVRPHYLQGGDIDFLDISKMWNMALGSSQVIIDAQGQANNQFGRESCRERVRQDGVYE